MADCRFGGQILLWRLDGASASWLPRQWIALNLRSGLLRKSTTAFVFTNELLWRRWWSGYPYYDQDRELMLGGISGSSDIYCGISHDWIQYHHGISILDIDSLVEYLCQKETLPCSWCGKYPPVWNSKLPTNNLKLPMESAREDGSAAEITSWLWYQTWYLPIPLNRWWVSSATIYNHSF